MAEIHAMLKNSPVIGTLKLIEARFDEKTAQAWMKSNWWMSFVYSAIYLLLVYYGTKYMKDRKPFQLRVALCMWSTGLALFSMLALSTIIPLFLDLYRVGGFEYTVCDMQYVIGSTGRGLYAFLFPLSKLPELVDTAFNVLRKSKISFLHCYHHVSVFIYCWFSYAYPISTGVWFGTVNFFVHAVMYSYYAVKASGRNPPRWVARCVTILQLSQMFFGIYLNYTAIRAFLLGKTCGMDSFTVFISLFFYISYAILFANFYYWAYVYKKGKPTSSQLPAPQANGVFKENQLRFTETRNTNISTTTSTCISNGGIRHR